LAAEVGEAELASKSKRRMRSTSPRRAAGTFARALFFRRVLLRLGRAKVDWAVGVGRDGFEARGKMGCTTAETKACSASAPGEGVFFIFIFFKIIFYRNIFSIS